jgi:hypothetical protein
VITLSPQQVPALVEMLQDAATEAARVTQKRRLSSE